MGQWKLFVASAQSHPNILAHQDFQCIRDLLQSFGAYITYETCKLMVELDVRVFLYCLILLFLKRLQTEFNHILWGTCYIAG